MFHEHTKHINVMLHFIRGIISQDLIKLAKEHFDYNSTDMGIKVLSLVKFRRCLTLLNFGKDM